ncbi:Aste57867_19061 [Aphanomyces stellatus]|uniref:Aste57867_19061 protein n=1 Tax=Aphanomyces stellatus TaxID=120398 RepID=A0A485LCH8_9STRA|nr:hypothetical protein As57867_018997 [Aphanomyces stellatus]VFT95786.1 Aste57867_19061 [Aphanomyces stellatus]
MPSNRHKQPPSHILTSEDDSIPRVRWNDSDHRFHYTVPTGQQPGKKGFVILEEVIPTEKTYDLKDSSALMSSRGVLLSPRDKTRLEEMNTANELIHDLEVAKRYADTIKSLEHKRSRQKSGKESYEQREISQGATSPTHKPQRDGKFSAKQLKGHIAPAASTRHALKQPQNAK